MRFPPNGPEVRYINQHDRWDWIPHLIGLLLVAAIVAVVFVLVMRIAERRWPATAVIGPAPVAAASPPPPPPTPAVDPAVAQLRMRYANGEVTRDDYVRMASDLGAPVASSD